MSKKDEKDTVEEPETQQETLGTKETGEAKQEGVDAEEGQTDAKAQLADMNDKYLRLYSDFDNYRKRVNKEKLEMIKTASSGVVLALLPVIDDMERAIKAFQETIEANPEADDKKALVEGVDLIYNKLVGVLKQQGVSECQVLDLPFDPETAEAVAQIPAPEEGKKGKVLDVIQKGYAIDGKVLRFAKVVVGC